MGISKKHLKTSSTKVDIKILESDFSVYDIIRKLKPMTGVNIGDYEYELDGEAISGYHDYPTKQLMEGRDFIPVVRIVCIDGWLETQDTKGQVTRFLS